MVEVGTGSTDGVAPSRMVSVSASVNDPLHHKVQKFSSGTGSPGWSRKKVRKTVVVGNCVISWERGWECTARVKYAVYNCVVVMVFIIKTLLLLPFNSRFLR